VLQPNVDFWSKSGSGLRTLDIGDLTQSGSGVCIAAVEIITDFLWGNDRSSFLPLAAVHRISIGRGSDGQDIAFQLIESDLVVVVLDFIPMHLRGDRSGNTASTEASLLRTMR
jgi:hypothetical protein